MARWIQDYEVETKALRTTGGKVWDAARYLFKFLEVLHSHSVKWLPTKSLDGKRYLELGSGCGWLGCNLANNLPDSTFVLTEQEEGGALEWLQHNINLGKQKNVEGKPLDWSSREEFKVEGPWDMIIGSDLVYNEVGAKLLPLVMKTQCDRSNGECPIFYAHTLRRFDHLDEMFFENLQSHGLQFQEVFFTPLDEGNDNKENIPKGSVDSLGPRNYVPDDFFSELFATQRLTLFYIKPMKTYIPSDDEEFSR